MGLPAKSLPVLLVVAGVALAMLIGERQVGATTTAPVEDVNGRFFVTVTKSPPEDRERRKDCVVFKAEKDVYGASERVVLVLRNECDFPVTLPNTAPWVVLDSEGRLVFSPIAAQVLVEVGPGESRRWVWEQVDNEGRKVEPGLYFAEVLTSAGKFTALFEIAADDPRNGGHVG